MRRAMREAPMREGMVQGIGGPGKGGLPTPAAKWRAPWAMIRPMILFGLLAVLAIVAGAALILFAFIHPPDTFYWVNDIEIMILTRYIPGGAQRFIFGFMLIFGVPYLLFGVLSNHL